MAVCDGAWKEREPSALLGRHLSLFFPDRPTRKFLKLADPSFSVFSACLLSLLDHTPLSVLSFYH